MKSKLLYLLTYVGMWLLAVLPFPVLYALSDFIYFWLYHVIGYRRKVVRTNLKNSFPEKSDSAYNTGNGRTAKSHIPT